MQLMFFNGILPVLQIFYIILIVHFTRLSYDITYIVKKKEMKMLLRVSDTMPAAGNAGDIR